MMANFIVYIRSNLVSEMSADHEFFDINSTVRPSLHRPVHSMAQ